MSWPPHRPYSWPAAVLVAVEEPVVAVVPVVLAVVAVLAVFVVPVVPVTVAGSTAAGHRTAVARNWTNTTLVDGDVATMA